MTSLEKDYSGYYADVDGDGTVDGIIYADLAHSKSGNWGTYNQTYTQNYGIYSYSSQTNLKEYKVSAENSSIETFGKNKVIQLKRRSTGNARFYVMALEDFTTEAYVDPEDSSKNYPAYTYYYWYKNSYLKVNGFDTSENFGTGYTNTGTMIERWNKNGEGTGYYSGATQDNQDIFKHIQEKYKDDWYIPSKGEWAAFADYLYQRSENSLTINNYNSIYKLSDNYFSSSIYSATSVWLIVFSSNHIYSDTIGNFRYVRLGKTF